MPLGYKVPYEPAPRPGPGAEPYNDLVTASAPIDGGGMLSEGAPTVSPDGSTITSPDGTTQPNFEYSVPTNEQLTGGYGEDPRVTSFDEVAGGTGDGPNTYIAQDPNASEPDTTGGPQAGNNPINIPEDVRAGLPAIDGTIDPSQFAAGESVQSDVATLAPPTDIDAATIGEYTPYEEVLGSVDDASTVESRLSGLLSQDSDYMQRAESKAMALSNRRGMLNSSISVGAAQGAAIDAALPIAQQDAAAFLEQQFLNQGYSNEAAKHLADASISRQNLQAGLEQSTSEFNQTNSLENQRLNQAAQNASNAAFAAEQNKNNFATLSADLQSQLAQIDNDLAMNLEQLASTFDIMQNLDSVNGSIYQQMVAEIGQILTNEDKVDVAQAKINNLLAAAGIEFAFSNGQEVSPNMLGDDLGGGSGGGTNTGDPATDTIGGIDFSGGGEGGAGEGSVGGTTGDTSDATVGSLQPDSFTISNTMVGIAAAVNPTLGIVVGGLKKVLDLIQAQNFNTELDEALNDLAEQMQIDRETLDTMKLADLDQLAEDMMDAIALEDMEAIATMVNEIGSGGGETVGAGDVDSDTAGFGGFGDDTSEADNPGSTGTTSGGDGGGGGQGSSAGDSAGPGGSGGPGEGGGLGGPSGGSSGSSNSGGGDGGGSGGSSGGGGDASGGDPGGQGF